MATSAGKGGRPMLRAFTVLYVGGMAGWYLFGRTPVADWWLFRLVDLINVWFYLPLPLLLLSAWLGRDARLALWLAMPLLTFVADYGLLLPPNVVREQGIPLRVMTANVLFTNEDLTAIADALLGQNADVIALQELGTAMTAPLADRVRDRYPHQLLYPSESAAGMGILSRHPVTAAVPPEMVPGGCNCQQVTIQVEGRPVTILNVHPFPPAMNARRWGPVVVPSGFSASGVERTILSIRDRARAVAHPLVILGDLNTTDRQPAYRILGQLYRDAHREAGQGLGFTFPTQAVYQIPFYPLVRIDYVLHDEAWAAQSVWTESLPGSDHRAVVADLVLRGG